MATVTGSTDHGGASIDPQQVEVHTILSFEGTHHSLHTSLSMSLFGKSTAGENDLLLQNLQIIKKIIYLYHMNICYHNQKYILLE